MTDLEISKALALAIGWTEGQLLEYTCKLFCPTGTEVWAWKEFDYRDWNVIAPIAERYDAFPRKSDTQGWWLPHKFERAFADTPQKAIALAVINSKGQLS